MLEVDSILATFGLLFLFQGLMLRSFGGAYTSYAFLAERFELFGAYYGLNRVVAFGAACVIALALYLFLYWTRYGTAVRAVAVNPGSARLVGIDVAKAAALSFALGGALTACGGTLISSTAALSRARRGPTTATFDSASAISLSVGRNLFRRRGRAKARPTLRQRSSPAGPP